MDGAASPSGRPADAIGMILDSGTRVRDVELTFAALLAVAWPLYDHYID